MKLAEANVTAEEDRQARLAAALRANLKRRKSAAPPVGARDPATIAKRKPAALPDET